MGLIAIDPTLSIMICTKENAAAQAVAEHIVSMQLPENLLCKFGRLIGFHEAQKGASARTAIDVGSQNRNQVLRGKQVIIGCGGGFRHETAQKYSPVLEWMTTMRRNNLVTWMKWRLWPDCRPPAFVFGLVTTNRPQGVSRRPQRRLPSGIR